VILVDSSVWIDSFRGTTTPQAKKLMTSLVVVDLVGQTLRGTVARYVMARR